MERARAREAGVTTSEHAWSAPPAPPFRLQSLLLAGDVALPELVAERMRLEAAIDAAQEIVTSARVDAAALLHAAGASAAEVLSGMVPSAAPTLAVPVVAPQPQPQPQLQRAERGGFWANVAYADVVLPLLAVVLVLIVLVAWVA